MAYQHYGSFLRDRRGWLRIARGSMDRCQDPCSPSKIRWRRATSPTGAHRYSQIRRFGPGAGGEEGRSVVLACGEPGGWPGTVGATLQPSKSEYQAARGSICAQIFVGRYRLQNLDLRRPPGLGGGDDAHADGDQLGAAQASGTSRSVDEGGESTATPGRPPISSEQRATVRRLEARPDFMLCANQQAPSCRTVLPVRLGSMRS